MNVTINTTGRPVISSAMAQIQKIYSGTCSPLNILLIPPNLEYLIKDINWFFPVLLLIKESSNLIG